MQLRLLDQR